MRKRLWWALFIDDKWNSYTYGRPVNIEGARSNIPPLTLDDGDGGRQGPPDKFADISCFIAMSRLSVILESLVPLLLERDGAARRYGQEGLVIVQAASELGKVYRDLPRDLEFNAATAGYPARPGSRTYRFKKSSLTYNQALSSWHILA